MRVRITIIATVAAMLFIVLINFLPQFTTMFLTLELVLLPSIYIIGNYYAESLVEEEYKKKLRSLTHSMNVLNRKYYKQKMLANKLRRAL